jgi:oligosaccharide repeat unit polymerase
VYPLGFIFYFQLALLALWFSKYWYGDLISPLSIFVGVNSTSLALYHLKMMALYDISLMTHLIALAGLMAFVVGSLMASGIPFQKPIRITSSQPPTRGLGRFFYSTGLLSSMGWVVALRLLAQRYSLSFLYSNPWILQSEFQMQFIGYLNLLGVLILPTFVLKWLLDRRRLLDLLVVLSALFGLVLAGIKSYFMISFISAVFVFAALRPGKIRVYHVVLISLVGLAFFAFYDKTIDVFVPISFRGATFPNWLNFLQRPYLYFVGSWPALDRIVHGHMPAQVIWGQVTLQPLWKVLGDGLQLIEPIPSYLPAVNIGASPFNVFSFIGEVYWDYGIVGVAILSLLLGFWGTRLYLQVRHLAAWQSALLYGIFAYVTFISFFAYYFQFTTIFLLLYIFFLGFALRRFGVEG